ncbi:MAG: hypothetical protein ABIQ95_02390 [Bdellovibrionia bacterium]
MNYLLMSGLRIVAVAIFFLMGLVNGFASPTSSNLILPNELWGDIILPKLDHKAYLRAARADRNLNSVAEDFVTKKRFAKNFFLENPLFQTGFELDSVINSINSDGWSKGSSTHFYKSRSMGNRDYAIKQIFSDAIHTAANKLALEFPDVQISLRAGDAYLTGQEPLRRCHKFSADIDLYLIKRQQEAEVPFEFFDRFKEQTRNNLTRAACEDAEEGISELILANKEWMSSMNKDELFDREIFVDGHASATLITFFINRYRTELPWLSKITNHTRFDERLTHKLTGNGYAVSEMLNLIKEACSQVWL